MPPRGNAPDRFGRPLAVAEPPSRGRPSAHEAFSHGQARTGPQARLRRLRHEFYDLTRAPAICPKCGTEQPAEQPRLRRAAGALPAEEKLKKRAVAAEAETDDVELEDVEADETVEDAEELEDEADAIGDEIEVEGDRDEEG
ncbi:FYDLN acid domain-containing protein [Siccirubricoccus deserti]